MGELLKHAMNSLSRESPDFKKALNVLLKYEIYTLLQRLSDNGEESVVITASVSDGIKSHLGSSKGEGFIQNAHQLDSLKDQFLQYCWGKYDGNTSTRADKPVSTDTIVIKSEPKDTVDLVMTRVDSDPEDGIQQHSVTHTPNKQPRVSCSSPSSLRTQATGGQVNSSRVSPSVTSSSTSETGPCTVLMRSPSLGQNNVSTLHSPMTLPTRETSLGYRSNATQQSSLANLGQGSGRECRSQAAETVASIEAYEAQQLVSGNQDNSHNVYMCSVNSVVPIKIELDDSESVFVYKNMEDPLPAESEPSATTSTEDYTAAEQQNYFHSWRYMTPKRKISLRSVETKYRAILEFEKGTKSKAQIATEFSVIPKTLINWLKNADKIKQAYRNLGEDQKKKDL